MGTNDFLPPAVPILPEMLLHANLLKLFLIYLGLTFIISLSIRLRFYRSVYEIAMHVRQECPNIFLLIHEHWLMCLSNGLIPLVSVYAAVLIVYSGLNNLVWPFAFVSLHELADPHPWALVAMLCLVGVMITVDALLITQVSRVNVAQTIADLNFAESWLGGHLNQMLNFLGRWNPIKKYADQKAHENLVWMNGIFHQSVASMIVQLLLRLTVAISLFMCHELNL